MHRNNLILNIELDYYFKFLSFVDFLWKNRPIKAFKTYIMFAFFYYIKAFFSSYCLKLFLNYIKYKIKYFISHSIWMQLRVIKIKHLNESSLNSFMFIRQHVVYFQKKGSLKESHWRGTFKWIIFGKKTNKCRGIN